MISGGARRVQSAGSAEGVGVAGGPHMQRNLRCYSVGMWSLIRGEPDAVIRWGGPLILGGMLLGFAAARIGLPGVITAVFAIGLGASGGSFAGWRHERGLWMLAGVFIVFFTTFYGLSIFGQIRDFVRGAPQNSIGMSIDFSLATMLLSTNLRFLWRVAKYNWRLSRKSGSREWGIGSIEPPTTPFP